LLQTATCHPYPNPNLDTDPRHDAHRALARPTERLDDAAEAAEKLLLLEATADELQRDGWALELDRVICGEGASEP
jgi:hypothetical protein